MRSITYFRWDILPHRKEWISRICHELFHRWRNRNAVASSWILNDRVVLRVDEKAREGYEQFCYKNRRSVNELKAFGKLTSDCHVLYDIGSLHGIFSLYFTANSGKCAYAFEPSSLAFPTLESCISLNKHCNVTAYNIALGDNSGKIRMQKSWLHLVALPASQPSSAEFEEIPIRTLDSLTSEIKSEPDVLKIDVEGYEYHVLLGARQTLKQYQPIIFLELHPKLLKLHGISVKTVLGFLENLRYRITNTELKALAYSSTYECMDVINVICRHQSGISGD